MSYMQHIHNTQLRTHTSLTYIKYVCIYVICDMFKQTDGRQAPEIRYKITQFIKDINLVEFIF